MGYLLEKSNQSSIKSLFLQTKKEENTYMDNIFKEYMEQLMQTFVDD